MYAEFASDPKVQLLAFDDQRHFIMLLCLKCNGTLDSQAPSPEFFDRMIAKSLGMDTTTALEARRRLKEVGLIDDNWQPIKWEIRQYDSDLSTGRVRKHRMKRQGNVSETDESREEESRTEQNRTEGTAPPDGLNLDAWIAWTVYRKQIGKPVKPASIPAAQRKLAAHGTSQAAVVEQSIANGWQGLFELKSDIPQRNQQTKFERAKKALGETQDVGFG
jgi:hypothetical protein